MKKIDKEKEPWEWRHYRKTQGVAYAAIPKLRESLLEEQGYLCAYCLRRIPATDKNSQENSRIDHFYPQTLAEDNNMPEKILDYDNLVICCPGAISSATENFHCDKSKKESELTFSLFREDFIDSLKYKSFDGTISSTNTDWDKEINIYLNLNNALLKSNRKETLSAVIENLKTDFPGKSAKKNYLVKLLSEWESRNNENQFRPYCGIVIHFLKKRLQSI